MKNLLFLTAFLFTGTIFCAAPAAVSNDFEKGTEGWNTPQYWNGKLTRQNGKMTLLPTQKNGQYFGRCTKMLLNLRHLSGALLELEFTASGKGTVTVGAMVFPESPRKPYMAEYGRITLTSAEKKHKIKLDHSKIQTDRISLTFEIPSGAALTFDNIKVRKLEDKSVRIQVPAVPVMRGKRRLVNR